MSIYELISQAVVEGNTASTTQLTKQAIGEGYPAEYILEQGLIAGIDQVADKFNTRRVIIPEVLLSSRAMYAGLKVLQDYLKVARLKNPPKVVIGTVEEDIHDIGKNLVKLMIVIFGVEVIDLGVNVQTNKFIEEVEHHKPDFLMLSCLLTTTMEKIPEVLEGLEAKGLRQNVKVMIGGRPITEAYRKTVGADYYFKDAFAVRKFFREFY